ncbi:MAG: hypothetical protein ABW012_04525 [Gaiellaceae bacterium]
MHPSEHEARYEARREAAPAAVIAVATFVALALVSWRNGWELIGVPWWSWLVLAVPGAVLCLDLWLGAGRLRLAATRTASLVLLGAIALGNIVAVGVLVGALVTVKNDDLSGGQLLLTTTAIWLTNVIVFGLCFWDLDDGGPFERAQHKRSTPDFRFAQDETPDVAWPGWRPRVWDYVFVALTSATAFSPTDTMPLTLKAKLLVGVEEVVSLVLIVLVTARAVSVLGT